MGYQKLIEVLFGFGLTINAALFIPQILRLFKTKNTEGLSILTFLGFNCIQVLGILHCYFNKDYFPMLGWIASLCACGSITLLIMLYKLEENNPRQQIPRGRITIFDLIRIKK